MAWWRERLEELDAGASAPAEPRLRAVAAELLPRGVSGADLSRLEDAWLPLLEPFPWVEEVAEGLRLRGRTLFGIGADLLNGDRRDAEAAGALWSLADAAFHCTDAGSRDFLLAQARVALAEVPTKMPRKLRSLTVVAALAASEVLGRGAARRVAAAATHRLRGTTPRG